MGNLVQPASAWSEAPFQPLEAEDPREIGGYRVLARLGAGGMGRVFLGSTQSGRRLAIKVIRPEFMEDPQFRRRFEQEVEAAQRVQSIFTAAVVDADVSGPRPWLATAWVPGPSLGQAVMELGPLPADTVRVLVAGIAEALQAVHRAGVVHRDLKPANVLLAPDGPRVIDFGIARAADSTPLTKTGLYVGSPQYMSPEQALGQTAGPASDVFALGSTACFAATGRSPFGGDGPDSTVLYRIVHQEPDLTGCPEPILSLVRACLAKSPEDRPPIQQIIETLVDAAAGPEAGADEDEDEGTRQRHPAQGRGAAAPTTADWLPPALAPRLAEYAAPAELPPPGPPPAALVQSSSAQPSARPSAQPSTSQRRSWISRISRLQGLVIAGALLGLVLIASLVTAQLTGSADGTAGGATGGPGTPGASASGRQAASGAAGTPSTPAVPKKPAPGRYEINRQLYSGDDWTLILTYIAVDEDTLTAHVDYVARPAAPRLTCKVELPTVNVIILHTGEAVPSKETYCTAHRSRPDWSVPVGRKFKDYAVFPLSDELGKPFTIEWQAGLKPSGKLKGIVLR